MKSKNCKRMLVGAFGIQGTETAYAENKNFSEDGCKNIAGACGCVHAEINLLELLPNPELVVVTHSPCLNCAKALVKANVKRVIYSEEYRIKDGIDYLRENNVIVESL